jgi:hypothetical protein
MKKGTGFEQCYNAQAAVDKCSQIIVAAYVTQAGNDKQQLQPLVERTVAQVGVLPDRGLADAGYFSEAVAESLKQRYGNTTWLISPGRLAHSSSGAPPRGRIPRDISVADLMRRKLSGRFSFRGLAKVQAEWQLVCAAHNLLKIVRYRRSVDSVEKRAA